MLKGYVFSKQIFENPIFALFINTFLNGQNGVSNNYKNGMNVTYNGSNLTIDSGAVCIQGRFLGEDSSTTISAGTTSAYCKLVIEINLDNQNTEEQFNQASYKIVTSTSAYPNLTQTDIVKNNSGVYQYELARFKTGTSGITDFQDMRTFLDFDSIYQQIKTEYQVVLQELEQELADVEGGSAYVLKGNFAYIESEHVSSSISKSTREINYPDGFNFQNTVLVGLKGKQYFILNSWRDISSFSDLSVNLNQDNILIYNAEQDNDFQLVLMKTDFLKE